MITIIAPPSVDHADSLWALFRAIQGGPFRPHALTLEKARSICTRPFFDRPDVYACLFTGDDVVAYGLLRGWEEGFAVPSLGVVVHPEHRHHGYATSMINYLHEAARRRGAARVRLRVAPDNEAALSLYRKIGYTFSGELDREELVGHFEL